MTEATMNLPVEAHAAKQMPARAEMRVVELGETLKPSPAKAETRRIGIVPSVPNAPHVGPAMIQTADGFQFPANPGTSDTNVVSHGGTLAPAGIPVQLIFWGNSWNTTDATLRNQITNAAMNVIEGPYTSALNQFGCGGASVRGTTTITSPAAPASFDDGTIGNLVWNCIGAGFFPKPNNPGGRNFYCVFMPPGTSYSPGGALGAHSWPQHYDFPFDWENAWVAWIGHADINTMTRAFAHEMVETITDPEGGGWYVNSTGAEIGDLCNSRQTFLKGVLVEGYWARGTGACVVPECAEVVSAVVRSADHLDVFAAGPAGGTQTAAWESDFADGWHGWWNIRGGITAPGSAIFGVSRAPDHLDIFTVGTDMRVYTAAWEPSFADGWHGWWQLPGITVAAGSNVHAVSRSLNHLDVFAVASDSRIMTCNWSPATGWSAWSQINGGLAAPGTTVYGVCRNTDLIDIFTVGTDHHIYTAAFTPSGGWHGWWPVAGGVAAPGTSVYPVSRSLDHLDIFAVGTDHGIYSAAWEPDFADGWHGWWQIRGGVAAPGTSVFGVSRSANHLDIFAVGTDHRIYTAAWQPDFADGWHGWWNIRGGVAAPGTSVFAVSRSADKLDVFAVGTDHGIYTAAWQPDFADGWHGWWRINGGSSNWGM